MKPINHIPDNLLNRYSMNNRAEIIYQYDDATKQEVQDSINSKFNLEELQNSINRVLRHEVNYYGHTDQWLYQALDQYPIFNQNVALIGSTYPWYEAVLLTRCPNEITVIEYSDRKLENVSKLNYCKPNSVLTTQYFDSIVSISSFEHDGLGRYGDPLNPDGDLEAMQNLKKIVKPNGLLYLSVPIGFDRIYFNLHRVYGKYRFPMLVEGWDLIAAFGFHNPTSFKIDNTGGYQPVFVLKNSVIE